MFCPFFSGGAMRKQTKARRGKPFLTREGAQAVLLALAIFGLVVFISGYALGQNVAYHSVDGTIQESRRVILQGRTREYEIYQLQKEKLRLEVELGVDSSPTIDPLLPAPEPPEYIYKI
jgi:hypothetical protein